MILTNAGRAVMAEILPLVRDGVHGDELVEAVEKAVAAVAAALGAVENAVAVAQGERPHLKPIVPGGEVSDGTVIVHGHEIPPARLLIIDSRTGESFTQPVWKPGAGAVAATAGLPGWPSEDIERAYGAWLSGDRPGGYPEDRT